MGFADRLGLGLSVFLSIYLIFSMLHRISISTLSWAVLTVLWIGFCLTGLISLCIFK